MEIVTLVQVKFQLRITHTALDAGLTDLAERKEREVLQYLGFVTLDDFRTFFVGSTDTDTAIVQQADSALVSAVLMAVATEFEDSTKSWKDNATIAKLLLPYRVPGFSFGSTD